MRLCIALLALASICFASTVEAKSRHRHHRHHHHHARSAHETASHGSLGSFAGNMVKASNGATAQVNPKYTGRFQCLVRGLEAAGYHIDFMGGYRHSKIAGTGHWSKHATGRALDINQVGRNRVTRRLPASASAIASRCGLYHGAGWRHADAGHFEVP
jgi:hypothetical protein